MIRHLFSVHLCYIFSSNHLRLALLNLLKEKTWNLKSSTVAYFHSYDNAEYEWNGVYVVWKLLAYGKMYFLPVKERERERVCPHKEGNIRNDIFWSPWGKQLMDHTKWYLGDRIYSWHSIKIINVPILHEKPMRVCVCACVRMYVCGCARAYNWVSAGGNWLYWFYLLKSPNRSL